MRARECEGVNHTPPVPLAAVPLVSWLCWLCWLLLALLALPHEGNGGRLLAWTPCLKSRIQSHPVASESGTNSNLLALDSWRAAPVSLGLPNSAGPISSISNYCYRVPTSCFSQRAITAFPGPSRVLIPVPVMNSGLSELLVVTVNR